MGGPYTYPLPKYDPYSESLRLKWNSASDPDEPSKVGDYIQKLLTSYLSYIRYLSFYYRKFNYSLTISTRFPLTLYAESCYVEWERFSMRLTAIESFKDTFVSLEELVAKEKTPEKTLW